MSEADEIGMRDGSSMSALSPKCSLIAAVASSRKVDFTKSLVLRSLLKPASTGLLFHTLSI